MEDVDYQKVAEQYQRENEGLRLRIMHMQKNSLSLQLPELNVVVEWVEQHYLFCIVVLLAISYMGSFLIEAFETRRKFNGRR